MFTAHSIGNIVKKKKIFDFIDFLRGSHLNELSLAY